MRKPRSLDSNGMHRPLVPLAVAIALLLGFLSGSPAAAAAQVPASTGVALTATSSAVPAPAGAFRALTPARLLDTRNGIGAVHAAVQPGHTLLLQVGGRGGVPARGVTAVTLNVTATAGTTTGFLTVFPTGQPRPNTSNVNYTRGRTVANLVQVPIGDGRIQLFNSGPGSVHIVADVSGYYLATASPVAGDLRPVVPSRLADTRIGFGISAPINGTSSRSLQITGAGPVPASGVSAVAINVTALSSGAGGFLSVYRNDEARPVAANLNFGARQTVANLVMVPVGADGRIRFYNGSTAGIHVIVDVVGYYLAGSATVLGSFQALSAIRLLDTRSGLGTPARPLAAGGALAMQVTGAGSTGVLSWGATAVALNVTVAAPATPGYLTVYPAGSARPVTSNVNFLAGQTVGNTVVVPVTSDGRVQFANLSTGGIHLIVDVVGVYYDGSRTAGGLAPGQTLPSGAQLHTPHSEYVLTMQTDGDLVLRHGSTQVWHTNTGSHPGAKLVLLADGSMVVYSSSHQLLWNSRTSSHPGAGMSLLLNGSLSVALGTATLWSSAPLPYRSCDLVGPDPAGSSITRWNPVTSCVLASLNQSSANVSDVNIIIEYESGGDPNAINLWDLNAQAGHPSIGLIQVIAPTFAYYRSPLLANDLYDPAANLYAGLNYAIQTYGSIHNVPGLVSLRNGGGYKGYIVTR